MTRDREEKHPSYYGPEGAENAALVSESEL